MTPKVQALIADDEPLLRAQLRDTLASLWPELQVIGEASHGDEAVRLVAEHHPQVVFLDIEMPGMSGIETAAQLKGLAHVVFITAYDRYAVDAFAQGAIDYVLKPASEERLKESVARLRERVLRPAPDAATLETALAKLALALGKPTPRRLRWIQASVGAQIRLVPVNDVLYFQSDLKYTRVVTANGESLIRKPLRELIEELDPEQFWQIHRGTVVNTAVIIHAIREEERISLVLRGVDERVEVSRSYAHLFRGM